MFGQIPELIVPTGHTRSLLCLKTSPSGGLLASSSIDETIKIWDVAAGRELYTFRPGNMARDLDFSYDEKYLAVAAFNRVHILRTDTWEEVTNYSGWWTSGVRFHPRKNELYFISQRHNSTGDDPIKIYAASPTGGTPKLLGSVDRADNRTIPQLDLSPDGSTLLLVQEGVANQLIPTAGGSLTDAADGQRFTPDGDLFFINVVGKVATFGVRTRSGQQRWTLSTGAAEIDNFDLVHCMDFDATSGKFYWNNRSGKMANGNYQTGGATMYEMPPATGRILTTGPRGALYVTLDKSDLITAYELPNLKQGRTIGEAVLDPSQIAGSESPVRLSWGTGDIKSLHFRGRQVLAYDGPDGGYTSGQLFYSGNGELLAAGSRIGNSNSFSYRSPDRHPEIKRYKSTFADARTVAPSYDGKRLAVIGKDGYLVMDTEKNKFVAKGALLEGDLFFWEHAALSPTGDHLLLKVARAVPGTTNNQSHFRLVDVKTGNTIWQVKGNWDHPVFSRDGNTIFTEIFENLAEYSAADGREIRLHPLPKVRFPRIVKFNNRQEWATYTHDDRGYVYDLKANREYQLTVPGETIPFLNATFLGDDFVVLSGREGTLRIFDLRSRRYVAALIRYTENDDWALVAPDGRFDATPGAMQRMYYRVGRQRIALEQLFGGFYTPGLANEIFNRLPPQNIGSVPDINQLRPPPRVEIGYEPGGTRNLTVEEDDFTGNLIMARTQDAIIVVKGNAPQDRIQELRLYRNGKLLGDGERNLIVEDDTPEPVGNERRYRVRLLPGSNALRAVAVNSQLTESPPEYLTVMYNGPAAPPERGGSPATPAVTAGFSGPAGVTLHLVTVGIDKYANPSYNLNYAGADAGAIEQKLDGRMRTLVGQIRRHTIRDAGATQREILSQLQTIAAEADADDVMIFYFAGHGLVPDQERGDFYLVPHDVTNPADPARGITRLGISATTLRNLSTAVAAERQLFVLDACQSGGALANIQAANRGAAEEKAIAGLARTTGTHWLTATDSEQLATEFDALGHGAFTYVLLEGLTGKADVDGDNAVKVSELQHYLERELPVLTLKYSGQAQYPSSFGYGRDFTVVR